MISANCALNFIINRNEDIMKIAIISGSDISEDNGISIRAKRIYKVLKEEHDVIILYSNQKNFKNIFSIFMENLFWNLRLLYLIPKNKLDAVYVSSDFLGFFSIYFLSKLLRFNIIFEAHGTLSEENINKNRNKIIIKTTQFIEKFAISKSDYVIALSKNIYEFYSRYNKNIALVPVFIDESIKYRIGDNKEKGYKSIGLIGPFDMPANRYYLDFVYKNIDKFNEDIIFHVIGSCDYRINSSKIRYTGYIESYSEYLSKINSMDLVLIPSKISTSGPLNKILEAMMCSTPVLTTPEGTYGIDGVKHLDNILIVKEEEIIKEINGNIFDGNLLAKISANARNFIEYYYSKEVNEEKILKTIKNFN